MSHSTVIVGAGIAGLSTAFHLAERGAGPITLVDKGRVGSGSSRRSGGMSTMLMGNEAATIARGVSFDIFERFNRILADYEFHQVGCLAIYNPEQLEVAAQLHGMHRRAGARLEVLDREQVESRFPDLKLSDEEHGVLDLRGGWNEPDRYIPALTAKVAELGVEVREEATVEDFVVTEGGVQGVRLRGGEALSAENTVCTVNAWANTLLSRVDAALPVRSFVHERFVTVPFGEAPRLPATNDDATGVYYRPTEDGRLLVGGCAGEPEQVDPDFDLALNDLEPGAIAGVIREAIAGRLPRIEVEPLVEYRVGLVSYPLDFVPNIGPVARLPGLYLGTNFCSGGFGYHPVAGQLLAEYIVDGQTSIDATVFHPDRFADFDTAAWLAQDVGHQQMIDAHAARVSGFVRKKH